MTLLMAAKCGASGHVVAFEPDAFSREQIKRNFALSPSIKHAKIEDFACSDAEGSAEFYSSREGDLNASLRKHARDMRQTTAQVTTVDNYLRRSGLPVPRLVKIDTEGAEIRILKGARTLLETSAAILCELHPYAWESFGSSFDELHGISRSQDAVLRSRP
jgi:FkbM family methyltransferase